MNDHYNYQCKQSCPLIDNRINIGKDNIQDNEANLGVWVNGVRCKHTTKVRNVHIVSEW